MDSITKVTQKTAITARKMRIEYKIGIKIKLIDTKSKI